MSGTTVGFLDGSRTGAENMALDQAMLEQSAAEDRCLFRVYSWSEPTLSLGYFQPYSDRQRHPESSRLAVVRRKSGGGAIVHDQDWTYSVAAPARLSGSSLGAVQDLYDSVHQAVVDWLGELGIQARRCDTSTCGTQAGECSFLCFERRSDGDVVAGDSKLLGSAQRRHQGALLQHGSLLLGKSEFAPSLPGVAELRAAGSSGEPLSPLDMRGFFLRVKGAIAAFTKEKVKTVDAVDSLISRTVNVDLFRDESWTCKR